MPLDERSRLRNAVLAGHAGSGKTSLAEHLLHTTGDEPVVSPASEPVMVRPVTGSASAEQGQLSFQAYNGGETFMGTCPDCGSQLEYAEGCVKCHVCGFSECG